MPEVDLAAQGGPFELRDCPFCDAPKSNPKSPPMVFYDAGAEAPFHVYCWNCCAQGPSDTTAKLAAAAWNAMPRRYLLLCGNRFYPSKWDDFIDTFATIDVAKAKAIELAPELVYPWAQIVDTQTMKVVLEFDWDMGDSEPIEWTTPE